MLRVILRAVAVALAAVVYAAGVALVWVLRATEELRAEPRPKGCECVVLEHGVRRPGFRYLDSNGKCPACGKAIDQRQL